MMRGGSAQLLSRNLHPFTAVFHPIAEALKGFPASLVLDGEVVVIGKDGQLNFEARGATRPEGSGWIAYIASGTALGRGPS